MPTPYAARARRLALLGVLAAATTLAAAACRPDGTGAAGPAAAPSATATGTPAASGGPGSAEPACAGEWGHVDVRLYGHAIAQDVIRLTVQEGRWTCRTPGTTVWRTIGPKHGIRLAENALISVGAPFQDSAVNRPVGVQAFLARLDGAAAQPGSLLVFGYRQNADSAIVRLDQRRRP
ncbi:hypothetical protein [Streptomyces sp. NPDC002265]|uniref:hypothetical protein n=1 Tax=Streptomyces sp. NPDC002265 TaxID=3154415 RepID=UPI0033206127